jgi:hypothetical protein
MLHVYNFRDATSTGTTTPPVGTTTPPTGTTTPPVGNQAILEAIRSIQEKIRVLQMQLENLIQQLNTNGGSGSGGNVFTKAAAHVASPSTVIGDTNDFAGDHFQPYEKVTMSLDGTVLMTLDSDKEGNWHTPSVFMPLMPGTKNYVFRGLSSGAQVTVPVQVTQLP